MKNIHYSLFIILCLVACSKHENTQRAQAPLKVKTMVVAPQGVGATSHYVGTIAPAKEIPLSLQTTGRVVAVHVKNGQKVRAGQTLVEVDNTQAVNALQSAEAALKQAQDGYNRVSRVHEKGVVSDQKMVEIESKLQQAKSLYAAAKQQLNECTLTAPCEGVISDLNIEKGQTLIPGARLCTLLDLSGFTVRFTVPEQEINSLTGQTIQGTVTCDAVDKVLPIVITEKSVTANPLTHTYDVTARVQGGKDLLRSGMVAKVELNNVQSTMSNVQSPIIIPARCILLKPEGPTVWLQQNGKAVRRAITTDGYQADGIRVTSGLEPGDTLIIDGYQKLYNDCNVITEN